MQKIILILSTALLLVGCTNELDRCIEANFMQQDKYKKDIEWITKRCSSYFKVEFETSEECVETRIGKFEDMFGDEATEDAKKICHSQGIY